MVRPLIASIFLSVVCASASAQDGDIAISKSAVEDVLACANLRGTNARIACFDAAAQTLAVALGRASPATASTPRAIVSVQPPPVASSPSLEPQITGRTTPDPVTSNSGERSEKTRTNEVDADFDPNAAEAREAFTATVVEFRHDAYDDLLVRLNNGQRWRQTEGRKVFVDDAPFDVEFKRGFMGGYTMRIPGEKRTLRVSQVR